MGIVKKDALKTSIVSFIGLVLGYLNKGFLFLIFLTTEEIGLINLLASVAILFAQFANIGSFNMIWRFLPFVRDKNTNHRGFLGYNLRVAFVGAIVITLIIILFRFEIKDYYQQKSPLFSDYFIWVIPTGIAVLYFLLLDNFARAIFKSVFSLVANEIIARILLTASIFLYAYGVLTFDQFVITTCLLHWIPTLLLVLYFRFIGEWKGVYKKSNLHRRFKKVMLNYSLYNYMNTLGGSIVLTIDALMVAGMIGMSETGVYTTVVFIVRALTVPYIAIMRVSIPIIPSLWKNKDMPGLSKIYTQVSSVSLFVGLTLFLYVWGIRNELFYLLPMEFKAGVYVFLFLTIGKVIDMYCGLNGVILITSKKYRYDLIFTGLLLVLVFILNFWLIPIWGMVGAAVSTAISYLMYNLFRVIFIYYHYKIHPFVKNQFIVILMFLGVITLLELVPIELGNLWLNLGVKFTIITLLFPSIIYIFNIEEETVGYVNAVLKKLKIKRS